MQSKPIRKAVFPVAGRGTRFLPATKAIPKEMLAVVDRPLIQYAVDEAREAGIEQMIFVTGRGKSAIEDHFDIAYELERTMTDRGKDISVLEPTRLGPGNCAYVRQQEPMGLGHAIWCARDIVGDEPFAIFLPDEFLGKWVATQTKVELVLWRGHCEVHERFTGDEIRSIREADPSVVVLAHPECPPEVLATNKYGSFEVDWEDDVTGLYRERREFETGTLYTEPAVDCSP